MVKGLRVLRHKRTEAGCFNEFLIAKTPVDVENCDPITTALPTVGLTHTVVYSTVATSQSDAASAIDSQRQAPINLPQPAPMAATSSSSVGSRIVQAAAAAASAAATTVASSSRAADPTEQARRAKRRERNRVAAAKCRKKRQDQLDGLADVCRQLEASNSDLEQQVAELASTKEQLLLLLRSHDADCSAGIQLPQFADAQSPKFDDNDVEEEEEVEVEVDDGGMELLETDSCFSPPMVTCCGSPPPVWRPATVATRPSDLLLPPEPLEAGVASLTTPLSALLTPQQPAVKAEQRP